MKSFTAIVALALVACASAGILSPYVGYNYGYYSAPVARVVAPVARVAYAAPIARVVAPAVAAPVIAAPAYGGYYASPYGYGAPIAAYSPYGAYSYLLKKK